MRRILTEYAHGGHILLLVCFLELLSLLYYLAVGETGKLLHEAGAAQSVTVIQKTSTNVAAEAREEAEEAGVSASTAEDGHLFAGRGPKTLADYGVTVTANADAVGLVALTFDDGPGVLTPRYLEVLAEYKVKATFFVIGRSAASYPEMVQAMIKAGHEVGVHSMNHRKLDKLNVSQLRKELVESAAAVEAAGGIYPVYFRPPYRVYNHTVLEIVNELGQKNVLWSIDPKDWESHDAGKITSHILAKVRPGDIIVLHENQPDTLAALPAIIEGIRAMDYQLGTLTEVLRESNLIIEASPGPQ